MALLLKDKLEISTPLGLREVQLLIGDITKLPVEEKVDYIFTSAFYSDYAPLPGTLIGSLLENLNINVEYLAMHKGMDLRQNFSCWVSEPLYAHDPYGRLVCFEYNRNCGTLPQQLSEIFRAMMPIFGNTETTVITPLLATGNQMRSVVTVMKGMVNGACQWIKAGLPLRCLKIVIFSPDPSKLTQDQEDCCQLFASLKNKWHEVENMTIEDSKPYDVCLSFTPEDKGHAEKIVESLKKQKPDISIHSEGFVFKEDCVWQEEIYSVMKNSTKIIIVLTPAYIADTNCLEQYSMALCCNQLKKAEVVMPLYLETIPSIPSYMSVVHYNECRVRKEGETASALLDAACGEIIKSLQHGLVSGENFLATCDIEALKITREVKYDIFVSYSHRTAKEPLELVDILRHDHPSLNVFFDRSELKAGNLWQQALYEAVTKAHCVVAFLSLGYIQSSVCNEEFNIALARQYAHDSILLIPVHTEAVETIPRRMSSVPCVDLGQVEGSVAQLAEKLVEMVDKSKKKLQMPDVRVLKQKLEDKRAADFKEKFRLDGGQVVRTAAGASNDLRLEGEIMFSFAPDCQKLAAIMSVIVKQHASGLVCHLIAPSQSQRRTHLDSADMVVIFVSDQFVTSQPLIEELHTVLCRQLTDKQNTVVYLIQCDHESSTPFYLQALPFSISLDDKLWLRLQRASSNKNPRFIVDIDGMEGMYRCTAAQNLALTAAVHDVIYTLSQRGSGSKLPFNILNIAQIENEMEGLNDEEVHVHEHIITLASINHLMCKEYTAAPSPKPHRKSLGHIETHLIHNKNISNDAQRNLVEKISYNNSDSPKPAEQKPLQDVSSSPPQPNLKIFQVQTNEQEGDKNSRNVKYMSKTGGSSRENADESIQGRQNNHQETPAVHHDFGSHDHRTGSGRSKRSSKTCKLL